MNVTGQLLEPPGLMLGIVIVFVAPWNVALVTELVPPAAAPMFSVMTARVNDWLTFAVIVAGSATM